MSLDELRILLKARQAEFNISFTELEHQTGFTRQRLERFYGGTAQNDYHMAKMIAKALHLNIEIVVF